MNIFKKWQSHNQSFVSRTNFSPVDYSKLTFLDFTVKQLSYPGEKDRFYAIVTVTGHTLKNKKANIILRKDGNEYKFNNEYTDVEAWEFVRNYKLTYDKVVKYLDNYFKEKNRNVGKHVYAKDKVNERECYWYFDTKEDAVIALCMFRKLINDYKGRNTNNGLIEDEIKVSFENND